MTPGEGAPPDIIYSSDMKPAAGKLSFELVDGETVPPWSAFEFKASDTIQDPSEWSLNGRPPMQSAS